MEKRLRRLIPRVRIVALFLSAAIGAGRPGPARAEAAGNAYQDGVLAFEQRRWTEALERFFDVLTQDPKNPNAHAYVHLITRQIELDRRSAVREKRLALLADASKRLEDNRRDASTVDKALLDTTQAEERAREERWHSRCEQARLERDLGHLLPANDLVLQVLSENSSHAEAQRELSELQSRLRKALDHADGLSMEERYAYEGFYAFGQADYPSALAAWQKVHALTRPSSAPAEAAKRVQNLRLAPYEKIAQDHVDEERRAVELRELFQRGLRLYEQRHFVESLDAFRQLAIREPEYPQLGTAIVQAEAAAEKDRARRLGEEKRQQLARLVHKGVEGLEHEQYLQAKEAFENALKLDPSYSQARIYLAMVDAEMQRRHDPKAAQLHYEAGLIAYASGRLDEAVREWHLATRLSPSHEKARQALAKVRRELALSRHRP